MIRYFHKVSKDTDAAIVSIYLQILIPKLSIFRPYFLHLD